MVVVATRSQKWPPSLAPAARSRREIRSPAAQGTHRRRPSCRVCSSDGLDSAPTPSRDPRSPRQSRLRRRPRRCDRWRLGGQAEVVEDPADAVRVVDGGDRPRLPPRRLLGALPRARPVRAHRHHQEADRAAGAARLTLASVAYRPHRTICACGTAEASASTRASRILRPRHGLPFTNFQPLSAAA